jgi:peptidyl-prolyl cis-trans isomerase B (cyclophilin B)
MIDRSPDATARTRLAVLACLTVLVLAACTDTGGSGTAAPSSETPTAGEASPAGGPTSCPTSQPEPLAAGETRTVTITTDLGEIVIAVDADLSPIATANFVALAECGYYDGVVFHRAAKLQDGTPFVIQGGDPTGSGSGGPGYTITDEPVTTPYARGTVAMARTNDPDSVGSQFFIVLDDGAADILASYNTYQIIGSVSDGIATADAILAAADAELPSDPVEMTDVSVSTP